MKRIKFNWGTAIVLFFIIFMIWAIGFVVFSFQHSNDLEHKDYYERGATYTQTVNLKTRSIAYRDSIEVALIDSFIAIKASPAIVQATDSLDVQFYNASDIRKDFLTRFIPLKKENFLLASNLSHGRYTVICQWRMRDSLYQYEQTIDIP